MAEIEAMASIIGVASAGVRLSLFLNAVSCEVAGAANEVHSISKNVTLFSMTLKQLGNVLQSAESVHSRDAIATAKSIAEESSRVLDEFNEMLDRVRTKPTNGAFSPTPEQRFRWSFKKQRVKYLLAQLESLKLSLSLLQQILQLGRLMASTSRTDPPEQVAIKTEAIRQERAEAQNDVIVRYWQMAKVDTLFEASQREEEEERRASNSFVQGNDMTLATTSGPQLTIDGPSPDMTTSTALVRLPVYSLGEVDQTLYQIKESPRDMIQVSDRAIDPLLERWTIWREVRERRHHHRDSGGRYAPSVHNLDEEDEDVPYHDRYREREGSPRGFYLEGTTTDWRKPHSSSARQEAFKKRKQYSNYQPSVSAASSDVEDSPGSNSSKKRNSKRHVIDSGSDSSGSEPDLARPKPRRSSSGSPIVERKAPVLEGPPLAHTYTAPTQGPQPWMTNPAANPSIRAPSVISSSQSAASRLSSPAYHPPGHRPWATPDQTLVHHSLSSPLPPVHTTNPLNPYAPTQPTQQAVYPRHYNTLQTPGPQVQPQQPQQQQQQQQPRSLPQPHGQPPSYGPPGSPLNRYITPPDPRMPLPPRPVSQDGKPRSPSRLGQYSSSSARDHNRPDEHAQHPPRHHKEKTAKQNLREGATKGLLGAGAIAGFLEALEGLNI